MKETSMTGAHIHEVHVALVGAFWSTLKLATARFEMKPTSCEWDWGHMKRPQQPGFDTYNSRFDGKVNTGDRQVDMVVWHREVFRGPEQELPTKAFTLLVDHVGRFDFILEDRMPLVAEAGPTMPEWAETWVTEHNVH